MLPIQSWHLALSQLAILSPGRLEKYISLSAHDWCRSLNTLSGVTLYVTFPFFCRQFR